MKNKKTKLKFGIFDGLNIFDKTIIFKTTFLVLINKNNFNCHLRAYFN